MLERRLLVFVSAIAVFLFLALLWSMSTRAPGARPVPPPPPSAGARGRADSAASTLAAPAAPTPVPAPSSTTAVAGASAPGTPPAPSTPPVVAPGGPSYLVLLARSQIRRRIRASAGLTYLNEVVAATSDSVLHRWDDRVASPVRVYLSTSTVTNFQPAFLDAVRAAFTRWGEAGVPVRFALDADSAAAEVRFEWRPQFAAERTGETSIEWDQDGHLHKGVVTLATLDPTGRPLAPDDVRLMAMHEIGHLLGLDHSPDAGDLMYASPRVRDLSARDIATVTLLYELTPGPLRAGS